MIYYKESPFKNYTKADNGIIRHTGLSDGAKILYLSIASLRNGHKQWEENLYHTLGLTKSTYHRRKKELVDAGLLLVVQKGPREYEMYLGHSKATADEVRARMNAGIRYE